MLCEGVGGQDTDDAVFRKGEKGTRTKTFRGKKQGMSGGPWCHGVKSILCDSLQTKFKNK